MAASEVFKVVGSIALEGQDALEKGLDAIGKKAEGLNSAMTKHFNDIKKLLT